MNTRNLFLLCFITFVIRVLISILLPLGNDEAYYVLYGRFPDFHYYDHPLLIGWAIRFSTWNFTFQHPFFYRLPSTLLSIPTTIIIYNISRSIASPKAGWISACMFSASIYGSVIAGVFAMPDSIMVFFWSLSLLIATKIFISDKYKSNKRNGLLLWFGVVVGLAMLAKLHAAFLWISVIGFTVFNKRELLKNWAFWTGIFITSLSLLPILIWNFQNNWAHFSFYSSRVGIQESIHLDNLLKEFLGGIAYQGPVVFAFILIFGLFWSKTIEKRKEKVFFLWMSLPLILFIWGLSIFRETLPHWNGPAYIALIIFSSISLAELVQLKKIRIWIWAALSFTIIIITTAVLLILYIPGTIGSKKEEQKYGSGDFTLDMYGWKESGIQIATYIDQQQLKNIPIYSNQWFPAAHLDEYVSRNSGSTVYAVGPIEKIHQYKWINDRRGGLPTSDSALCIVPTNNYCDPNQLYSATFHSIRLIKKIPQYRSGYLTRYFYVYLMCRKK